MLTPLTKDDVSFLRACGIEWVELEEIVMTAELGKPSKLVSPGLYKITSPGK